MLAALTLSLHAAGGGRDAGKARAMFAGKSSLGLWTLVVSMVLMNIDVDKRSVKAIVCINCNREDTQRERERERNK